MKLVRKGTFETNSSSTHSIVIPRKYELPTSQADSITFYPSEYGWGFNVDEFKDYLWTAILCCENFNPSHTIEEWKDRIRTLLSPYYKDIIFEQPTRDRWGFPDCYIDHSEDLDDLLNDLWEDDTLLINGILIGEAYTGNDNVFPEEDPYADTIEEYEDDYDDYYVFHKGN